MINRDRNRFLRAAWLGLEELEPRCMLSGNGVISVTQGLPDLQVTIAPSFKTPTKAVLSGTGNIINLPIQVTNLNETTAGGQTITVPLGETATVNVVARPDDAADDSQDVQVGTLSGVALGGLKVGAEKNLTIPVTLTDAVGGGNWRLVVMLDPDNTIAELGEDPASPTLQANNIAQTAAFPITIGDPDLTVSVVSDKNLPAATISGSGKTYNVSIRVTNIGTLTIPKGTTTTVKATQVSTLDDPGDPNASKDLPQVVTVDVGGLAPGHSVSATATVTFDDHVNDDQSVLPNHVDQQVFTFTVNPDNSIKELSESNNTASTKKVAVTTGSTSLMISQMANKQLPTKPILSGSSQLIKATVKITNLGNVTWDAQTSDPYNVTLMAVPASEVDPVTHQVEDTDAGNDLADAIPLVTPNLAPGKSTNYTMSGTLPINAASGQYYLFVRSNFTDTTGTPQIEYALAAPQTISIVDGFINLTPTVDNATKLPKITTSGNGGQFTLLVDIKNTGNLPTPKDAMIGAKLDLIQTDGSGPVTPIEEDADIPLAIGVIAPGKTKRIAVPYTINAGIGMDDGLPHVYVQQVTLVDTDSISELDTDDNSASSNSEQIIMGDPDLTLSLPAKLALPADVLAGTGKPFNLPVVVQNSGTLPTEANTFTTITVTAQDPDGGAPILVATLDNVDVSSLKPGASRNVTVPVTLTSDILTNAYTFTAAIDPANQIEELNDQNNTVTTTVPVQVTQGLADLAATMNAAALDGANVHSGNGSTITLPLTIQNVGNLATTIGQLIDIRVFAVNTSDNTSTDIATITGVKIGGLKTGSEIKLNLKVALPISLLDGTYQIGAEVDSGHAVPEPDDTDDNSTPLNGANNTALGPDLNVTQTGPNLTVSFPADLNLPSNSLSGDGSLIALPLTITNTGNLAVPSGQKINVLIQAHNEADGDDTTNDVTLKELVNLNLGGLAAGASRGESVDVTLPAGMGPGQFELVITVDNTNQLAELNETDNIAMTDPVSVTPSIIS